MKLISAIVNYILGDNLKNQTTKTPAPIYLPCNEIFGNLSKLEKPQILNYNYTSNKLEIENNIMI